MKTIHNLPFEVAEWLPFTGYTFGGEFKRFRVGTCEGLWRSTETSYDILAVSNSKPGNGHFEDVLQWFEHSCKRDGKALMILKVWNERLYKHLTRKRGFTKVSMYDVIKNFK